MIDITMKIFGSNQCYCNYFGITSIYENIYNSGTSVKTDKWTGYAPLKKEFVNLEQMSSGKKGENFPDLHRAIMGFKGWLRGIHHHADYLQAYI